MYWVLVVSVSMLGEGSDVFGLEFVFFFVKSH